MANLLQVTGIVDELSGTVKYNTSVQTTVQGIVAVGFKGDPGEPGGQGNPGQGVATGGSTGQVLAKNSATDYDTEWVDAPGGAVDSVNAQTGIVVLDADDIDPSATRLWLTSAERTKLTNTSGTNTGDQDLSGLVPNTRTVNGQPLSSNVTLTKSDVGLGNVDNTSDVNKPVSTAQQTALDAKQATLVSATNIKTINGNSLLGSGDLVISGGGGSGITRSIVSLTSSSTLGSASLVDYAVFVGAGGAPTLPTAVGNTNRYTVKNVDTTNKTLATTSSQTIDGSTTITLTPNTSVDLISDGTNWQVI